MDMTKEPDVHTIQNEKDLFMTKETYILTYILTKEPDGYDKRTRCTHDSKATYTKDEKDLYMTKETHI